MPNMPQMDRANQSVKTKKRFIGGSSTSAPPSKALMQSRGRGQKMPGIGGKPTEFTIKGYTKLPNLKAGQ
jgi:hypothetical protein